MPILFSTLTNGQHLSFDPNLDVLHFDLAGISAAGVLWEQQGTNLGATWEGKTIWLDGTVLAELSLDNVTFANGSMLVTGDGTSGTLADAYGQDIDLSTSSVGHQLWGLGGADVLRTGTASGADWLVGNEALAPLNHISRVGSAGAPTGTSNASVSADGRYVAFEGSWTGFGSYSDSAVDVIVKDVASGTVYDEDQSAGGTPGNSGSNAPVISADGSVLVFSSASSNLVATADGSLYDIYVSSVTGGAIERVSTGTGGVLATDGRALNPDVSADGRYVVFESDTSSWASGSTTTYYDIFVKDRDTGTLTRVSTSLTDTDGNGDSRYAKISADGRFVVFQSAASNLTAGDTNGYADVIVWDRTDGSLTNLSSFMGGALNPNNDCRNPDVAFDNGYGGVVVFETAKRLVAADTSNNTDIYAYNMFDDTFQLVSSKADGSGVSLSSEQASVSGDGRFVVFASYSDALVPGDANGTRDVFVKDLYTGAIALVSKSAAGAAGNGPSYGAEISLGGDWIVFESAATNLAATDANGSFTDVFRVANPLLLDILVGGAGNDTYVLARPDIVQEKPGGGIDTVRASISYVLPANVENLVLTGTANLNGTGNTLNNVLTGNAGNNVLNGGAGSDTASYAGAPGPVTVDLGSAAAQATGFGSDTLGSVENLVGSGFNDRLTGNAGNNVLDGGEGGDTMTGGLGNDTYVVGSNTDIVSEAVGAGTDSVISAVTWTLGGTLENLALSGTAAINGTGNNAANRLVGNAAGNRLTGGAGDDTLDGGAGADTMTGGVGNDTYVAESNTDIVSEAVGAGTDSVISAVTWTLGGTLENLALSGAAAINGSGNSAANKVTGNAAANTLTGAAGDDTVAGGGGNDKLIGGAGNDALTGGAGLDIFRFDAALGAATNKDTIGDFSAVADTIELENGVFAALATTGTLAAAAFWKSATATAAHDASDRIVYNTTTGALYYDKDGAGGLAAVQFATLTGSPDTVTNLDFVVT